ncbi:MAG: hypothetical protein KKD35_04910 [Elusimicrobia bacterium]|nr:hypothetical protein [Elusimicrobiota bacterium]
MSRKQLEELEQKKHAEYEAAVKWCNELRKKVHDINILLEATERREAALLKEWLTAQKTAMDALEKEMAEESPE